MRSGQERLLVIGTGMAAGRVVEEITARAPRRYEITMFGAEPHTIYNRILLSDVLAAAKSPESIFLYSTEWFESRAVKLIAGTKIGKIDRERKVIVRSDGFEENYDKLIIATGSLPLIPPIDNINISGFFVFRTIDDCQLIASYARRCRRAAVIGGGLLGLEAARGLLNHKLEVTVIEVMPYPMVQQLDPESGAMLARRMDAMGLRFLFEKATQSVIGTTAVRGLAFKDGTDLETDMVVVSCGIRPNVKLAVEADLKVERAIVCDDHLQSSDPDIYAVGECVEHRGRVYGLVAPLFEQARVLANHITGTDLSSAYRGSKLSTRLKVMGVDLVSVGDARPLDGPNVSVTRYVEPERGVYKKLVVRQGKISGAILLGEIDSANAVMSAFETEGEIGERHADLLFGGTVTGGLRVEAIPMEAQVCTCHQVSKARLIDLIGQGCKTEQLGAKTRAGTGCGGCRPQLEALIEAYGKPDPSASWYVKAVPLAKPDLVAEIKRRQLRSVSAVLRELGNGADDPMSKPGLASLLRTVWGSQYEDERDARFINDRVHANIQNDGTFSVVPRIPGGVTSPDQLRRLADVAEKYGVRMVKITGGQRIDLLGIRKENLPGVWRDLGMPSGHAYTKAFRTCKTCVGTDFCRYGVGDSSRLGIAIETRFQGIEAPHKMKLAVSGCARNCAEATVKDLGAVGVPEGWQVYVGGAAGLRVRGGDLLATVATQEEVLRIMGRFIQYYRENARYAERSPAFVERIGIDNIRSILLNESSDEAERLDREIEAEVAIYHDPWLEGQTPVELTQFAGDIVI
ncbi:MAG: NAD(P)/FAD-dependent oxidoreductase [Deltaproteobacteria bacterium]|nr:NAD(P)/FAD-dependent oxidoreductase [Deltaproteobacteria bacterium]